MKNDVETLMEIFRNNQMLLIIPTLAMSSRSKDEIKDEFSSVETLIAEVIGKTTAEIVVVNNPRTPDGEEIPTCLVREGELLGRFDQYEKIYLYMVEPWVSIGLGVRYLGKNRRTENA